MGNTKLSLKLLVDTKNNKVLFAEAGKDFVDFLFYLLSLPVATVARLIKETDMAGCIGELYTSVESLNSDYLLSNITKDLVLNPKTCLTVPLFSLDETSTSEEPKKKFYMCPTGSHGSYCYDRYVNIHKYIADSPAQKCPTCKSSMSTELAYVAPEENVDVSAKSKGYVHGVVTYMVMDDLVVKPMSTISGITLIHEFGVKDISALKEKQVRVTINEGFAILKASLETRTVLTSVFQQVKANKRNRVSRH